MSQVAANFGVCILWLYQLSKPRGDSGRGQGVLLCVPWEAQIWDIPAPALARFLPSLRLHPKRSSLPANSRNWSGHEIRDNTNRLAVQADSGWIPARRRLAVVVVCVAFQPRAMDDIGAIIADEHAGCPLVLQKGRRAMLEGIRSVIGRNAQRLEHSANLRDGACF